jgi:predicted transposase/invertase (TIGR01784 family)
MEKTFVSPLNDYVVKCIYGDQRNIGNTKGLLKTILDLPPEDYDGLTVIDPFLKRRWKKDKQGIVDIRLAAAGRRHIGIDIQILPYQAMRERIVYYNDKMTVEQLKSGHGYAALRQTISVAITNYTLLPEEPSYLNRIDLRNRESGNLFTDLQQYVILELSKLPDEDDGEAVWPFLRFFKRRTEEEFEMLKKRHPEVQPQVEEYQRLSWSQRRRLLADYWEKQRRDARSAMAYARDEGLEEGRAESQQALAEKGREIAESQQALAEKDREIEELRRKLREAGIDG